MCTFAVDSNLLALALNNHFDLSPPDFDAQNVFGNDEGTISGIID